MGKKLTDVLPVGSRIFVDTAPLVYFVERNSAYWPVVKTVFDNVDAGNISIVTSPVTLAECLIVPLRTGNSALQNLFTDLITSGPHTIFSDIDIVVAKSAANLRVRYNLTLTDAFQIAVAMDTKCDAFLTNDTRLQRVREVNILILGELAM